MATTPQNGNPLIELDEETCHRLLRAHSIGRLALSLGNRIDIFSVRYTVFDGKIYFQTKPEDTFSSIVVTKKVAFEIDEARSNGVRQVTVYGTAYWYPDELDIDPEVLDEVRVASPEAMHWVVVEPERVSGSELRLGNGS